MKTSLFSYPTPFTPPTTEEDEFSCLRLVRSRRVGPATYHRLISEHGSALAALGALPAIARTAGMENYSVCPDHVIAAELAAGRRAGARLILWGSPDYPMALTALSDAPPVLWALGDVTLLSRPMISVIGGHNASSLGLRMARSLAQDLGMAGWVVVSGLARGIDGAAHTSALDTGTVAVQAGGIDVIYPPEHVALAADIARKGVRISELPPGFAPRAAQFPQRNRIIAGLAQAVIVVEAAERSGSLGTARMALDYGREVMAVPGHPLDPRAAGCNMLLRDGALLVRNAQDVIAGLAPIGGPQPRPPSSPSNAGTAETTGTTTAPASPRVQPQNISPTPPPAASAPLTADPALKTRILSALSPIPVAEHLLLSPPPETAQLACTLLMLELDGQLIRHPGGMVSSP